MTDATTSRMGGYCEAHNALWYGSTGCSQCAPNTVAYQEREAVRELPGIVESRAFIWARAYGEFFGVLMRGGVAEKQRVQVDEAFTLASKVADDAVVAFDKRFGGVR